MKNKLIILRGLPASGKSTFAKAWVEKNPKERVRVNRDDIRRQLGPYWIPSREDLVTVIEKLMVYNALKYGYNVVLDATNFHPVDWGNQLGSLDFKIEYKDFTNVPLETCIERDKNRIESVGEEVIMRMYNKYLTDEHARKQS